MVIYIAAQNVAEFEVEMRKKKTTTKYNYIFITNLCAQNSEPIHADRFLSLNFILELINFEYFFSLQQNILHSFCTRNHRGHMSLLN